MKKSSLTASDKKILQALREGVRKAFEERKKNGVSFSVWKDGKVLTQPASKITAALLKKL
ncbi:MAG: hypothetical protein SFX19_05190 [Alphaproteobacteria bacterium]|nr:hypothetical protein [Alphaproteobacteria bacterium]